VVPASTGIAHLRRPKPLLRLPSIATELSVAAEPRTRACSLRPRPLRGPLNHAFGLFRMCMNEERVKCTECDNMILLRTAAKNEGLCAQCVSVPEGLRERQRVFNASLESGSVFSPSARELASAVSLSDLEPAPGRWGPYAHYYAGDEDGRLESILDRAALAPNGYVVLSSESSAVIILAFNTEHGVCEYRNETADEYRIAYTSENALQQVQQELQLCQICPCCGVGTLWYPSRFHMPRRRAFELIISIIRGGSTYGVQWLEADDISYTQPGQG
jgi:hypothetical protein